MTSLSFSPAQFQSFVESNDPSQVAPRLAALRQAMRTAGVDVFLIPRADAHRGEAVPASEARLAYITGFTGSAGLALIGADTAHLFVDSRYTLQAPAQTDTREITVHETGRLPLDIAPYVGSESVIAYDPWLHTPQELRELAAGLGPQAKLVPHANLVDAIWTDRPAPPAGAVEILAQDRAGKDATEKLAEIRATLAEAGADALVLTLPESICWLFNLRGHDVPHTPFVLGFAIVPKTDTPTLYLDPAKITAQVRDSLAGSVGLAASADFPTALDRLGRAGQAVLIDPASAPAAIAERLRAAGARLIERRDPVLLPKSRKNEAELTGMREAHRLDGVALAHFLCWFDAEAPKGELSEIDIVTALEAFRRADPNCRDASFETIAGAGPNGAIIHYRVTEASNRRLTPGEIMLIDSGAQYLCGTTDITRTLATGPATPAQKDRYTRVLKGMIALSGARFPQGTSGAQLDILARQFLWADGATYHHGTGHGVGASLGVHEGPVGISPRFTLPLEPGNVLSNEPGYYEPGAYGIRIENLLVVEPDLAHPGYLQFSTLTLVPIDRRLIDRALLTPAERDWLNAYHAQVWQTIEPHVKAEVRAWLEQATAAL